jgi:hypothetical protein
VSKFPSVAFQATSIQGDRASEAFKSWFMLSPLKIFAKLLQTWVELSRIDDGDETGLAHLLVGGEGDHASGI